MAPLLPSSNLHLARRVRQRRFSAQWSKPSAQSSLLRFIYVASTGFSIGNKLWGDELNGNERSVLSTVLPVSKFESTLNFFGESESSSSAPLWLGCSGDMSRVLLLFHNGRALQTSTSGIRSLRSWAHPAWNLWTDWWRLSGTTWWTNLSILGSASQSFSPTGLFLLTRSMTSWKVRYLINVYL